MPHRNKKALLKAGRLPSNLAIEDDALEVLMEHRAYLEKVHLEKEQVDKEKAMADAITDKIAV